MPSKQLRGTEGRKRRLASRLHCLTLPSEPTRNQLQSAAPMPSKQLHNKVLAGGCETAKHHGPEGRNAPAGTYNVAVWTDKKPAPKCSSHALKTAPQRSPSGRLRNSKTPWPWRTEAARRKQRLQSAARMPWKQLHNEVLAGGCETAPRHTETSCYWRTERPPKNMLPGDLTSLLDSGKNKASSAAGPAAAAPAAAGGAAGAGAASLQNAPFATPKHHATEGRNDLQKHAAPRLDVPSGFW